MLKGLVLALVLANLAFFAWTRGQTVRAEREPDRQAQQIRPESVRLLAPDGSAEAPPSEAASSAEAAVSVDEAASAAPTTLCVEAGPFSSTEVASAEAALAASPAASAVANRWTRVAAPDAAASAATAYRLRVDAATPDEAAALEALPASVLTRGFAPCAVR